MRLYRSNEDGSGLKPPRSEIQRNPELTRETKKHVSTLSKCSTQLSIRPNLMRSLVEQP